MKPYLLTIFLLLSFCANTQADIDESSFQFNPFGQVTLYRISARPDNVVIFISGDGGWADLDQQVSTMLAAATIQATTRVTTK